MPKAETKQSTLLIILIILVVLLILGLLVFLYRQTSQMEKNLEGFVDKLEKEFDDTDKETPRDARLKKQEDLKKTLKTLQKQMEKTQSENKTRLNRDETETYYSRFGKNEDLENGGGEEDSSLDLRKMLADTSQYVTGRVLEGTPMEEDKELMTNMVDKTLRKIIKPQPRSKPIRYSYEKVETELVDEKVAPVDIAVHNGNGDVSNSERGNEATSFTDVEKTEIDDIIQNSKGWKSLGWNFQRTDQDSGMFEVNGVGEDDEDSPDDVILHLKSREEMGKIFPQSELRGLSVTDMGSRPMRIFFDYTNWTNVPSDFVGDLKTYHAYVVQHEMGHVLGYEHEQPTGDSNKNCPVMYQQTKGTRGKCVANPWASVQKEVSVDSNNSDEK